MKFLWKYYLVIILLFCFACTEEEQLLVDNFVVEAFLFAGEPVNSVTVKRIQPIAGGTSDVVLIENAQVILTKDGIPYTLEFDVSTGKYAYTGTGLTVTPGDHFALRVTSGNRVAHAETIVPQPASGVMISGNKLIVPGIGIRQGIVEELTKLFNTARLTSSWGNTENQLHFVAIENIVKEELIFPSNFPIPQQTLDLIQSFRFISSPTTNTSFEIPALSLDTYGTYRAKVFRVNQEYADLYNNQVQDSRDLNEPPSNIRNALGIFSAFASSSVTFEVARF